MTKAVEMTEGEAAVAAEVASAAETETGTDTRVEAAERAWTLHSLSTPITTMTAASISEQEGGARDETIITTKVLVVQLDVNFDFTTCVESRDHNLL